MKRYVVRFNPGAHLEALEAAEYIAKNSPLNAVRWYEGLVKAVDSLRRMPHRCVLAPESSFLGVELRQLLYKSHRIIFRIDDKNNAVRVLHVRHGARRWIGQPMEPDDDNGDE